MAGRGRLPKPVDELARPTNRRGRSGKFRSVAAVASGQPELPDIEDGWPEQTRIWWAELAELPIAASLTAAEWSYLVDTALLHRAMWLRGEVKHAGEIRLRLSKYGITPEDRVRLRLEYRQPDDRGRTVSSDGTELTGAARARARYPDLAARMGAQAGDEFGDVYAMTDDTLERQEKRLAAARVRLTKKSD